MKPSRIPNPTVCLVRNFSQVAIPTPLLLCSAQQETMLGNRSAALAELILDSSAPSQWLSYVTRLTKECSLQLPVLYRDYSRLHPTNI